VRNKETGEELVVASVDANELIGQDLYEMATMHITTRAQGHSAREAARADNEILRQAAELQRSQERSERVQQQAQQIRERQSARQAEAAAGGEGSAEGGGPSTGRPVEIEGVKYPSITAAAQARGVSRSTIQRMLDEGSAKHVEE
jgi:hypothetical protein